jgi:hypothetical protein
VPLVLIKTTEEKDKDEIIARAITDLTMIELGVVESDVAVKFEKSETCRIDLYLYDKKQYPYQKDRTGDVFDLLAEKIIQKVDEITNKKFILEMHLIFPERCFRAGRLRF